jgi:hypothetical protein
LSGIGSFYRYCLVHGPVAADPTAGVKRPRVAPVLTGASLADDAVVEDADVNPEVDRHGDVAIGAVTPVGGRWSAR